MQRMPSTRRITTGSPFEKQYGYSRALIREPFVFVAGTTGYDYAAMRMPEDVAAQTHNIWKTIGETLAQADASLDDLVRATIYLTDAADAATVLPICGQYMGAAAPAASCVIVAGLIDPAMKVEIEVTAMR